MSTLMSAFSGLFGGGSVVTVLLLGMLAFSMFRPERVVNIPSFRMATLLLVLSVALPALVIFVADFKSMGSGEGILIKVFSAATTLCTAGSVYFLFDSIHIGAGDGR